MDSDSEWDGMDDLGFNLFDNRARLTIGGAEYYQSPDHWYEDGNIILLARNTAFRLFKSMLIKRSQVMKDIISPSQPITVSRARGDASSEQSFFEGIPVVKIDDRPECFGLLLDALLPSDIARKPISGNLAMGTLLGVARIAKKYQVQDVLAHTTRILENVLPTKQPLEYSEEPAESFEPRDHLDVVRQNVHTINWARFCGLPQFLPLPFYYLAILEDWEHASSDSVQAFQRLSLQDQVRIYRGRVKLQALIVEIGAPELGEGCQNHECGMGPDGPRWKTSTRAERWKNLLLNPLEELKGRERGYFTCDLCPICSQTFAASNRAMRDRVLRELGSCFTMEGEESEFGGCS